MSGKTEKCLWIVVLGSFVLVAYWFGTKRSIQSNSGGTNEPVVQGVIDPSKYGGYRSLKDPDDPSKGWGEWVLTPRTPPEELLAAERARAAHRVALNNRAKQEAAARLAQEKQWDAAREAERWQVEAAAQAERDKQRQHELALEQARKRSLDDKKLDNIEATVYDLWEQHQPRYYR